MAQFHLLGAAQELQPAFPSEHTRCPIAKDSPANRFGYVDGHLSNRPYLVGDNFAAADAYLFTILKWKFMAHVGGRPRVKDALRAERLD